MKAILSCIQDKSQFNGNLYYNLDYYSLSLLYDNNIKLIIITKSNYIDILKTIINDRYPNIKYNNIIIITVFPLLSKYKFKSILINSFDYIYLKPYIISKKIYIIHSLVPNNNNKQKTFYIDKNIYNYNECINTGFESNYKRKIYFDLIDKHKNIDCNNIAYASCTGIREYETNSFISFLHDNCKNINNFLIFNRIYNTSIIYNKCIFNLYNIYKINFLSLFNIYINTITREYDNAPRLILECIYLNKQILHFDLRENKIDDSFTERIKCIYNNRISEYALTKDDEVIYRLLND